MSENITPITTARCKGKDSVYDYAKENLVELLKEFNCEDVEMDSRQITCRCPFHLPVNNTKCFGIFDFDKEIPRYRCFSCGESGNVINLMMFFSGLSYKKSLKIIQKRIGIGVLGIGLIKKRLKTFNEISKQVKTYSEVVLPPRSNNQSELLKYLTKRSEKYHNVIDPEYIINKYNLYYCNEGRMYGRVIMPITINNVVVGYDDRSVVINAKLKSLHEKGSNHSVLVSGIDQALGYDKVIIVEGMGDMHQVCCILRLYDKICPLFKEYGVVSTMGHDMNEQRASIISELFDEAIILYDNDSAGVGYIRYEKDVVKSSGSYLAHHLLSQYMKVENKTKLLGPEQDPGCLHPEALQYILEKKNKSKMNSLKENRYVI